MIETKTETWRLDKIRPGKSNPRTDFNEEALGKLSESLATHGILQPLVTRPDWCIGKTPAEIAQINGNAPTPEFLEIVAGERRFRAALKAKLETAPVTIRHFSDQDVLEIHLIENLQREDLDPFEEAAGYRQLLDLRDANGKPVHTVKTIAARVHKDRARVYHRMKLLNAPSEMRTAFRTGVVGDRIAEMVGEIPTKEMREAATREILKPTDPKYGVGPLTVLQVRDLIETRFNRQLSAAQFDQKDPTLVPEIQDEQTGERIGGGACTNCPRRTGNMEGATGKTTRPDVCTNPECFAQKTTVQFARLQETAIAEGKKILTAEETEEIFDEDGHIYLDSDLVKLSDQPDRQEARSDFPGKLPSWKKLIDGLEVKPQLYIARDPRGRIVELVNRSLAIEAVNLAAKQKSERSIFDKTAKPGTSASSSSTGTGGGSSSGGNSGGGLDPFKEQERKNREIAKVNFQITLASMSAVIAAIDDKGPVAGFWDELIKAAITHAGHDGCWLICKRHGLDSKVGKRVDGFAGEGVEGAALEYGLTLPDEKMKIGYVVELLLSQRVKFSNSGSMGGIRSVKPFTSFAKLYGVDLAAVEKETREAAKEKKTPKSDAPTTTPGKMHWTRKPEGEFTFNANGVCEKPATLVLPFPKTTRVKIELYVARSKSGWVSASNVELGGCGVGSGGASSLPSCGRKSDVFTTSQQALEHELVAVDFQLVAMQAKPAVLKTYRAYVGEIKANPVTDPVAKSNPTASHIWEEITPTKFRCKGCGAAAVKVAGKKSQDAESTKMGLLLVAKQFRGKPCSQAELPLGDVIAPKKSKSKPAAKKTAPPKKKNPPPRKTAQRRQSRKGGGKK